MDELTVHDLTAAYALDALDATTCTATKSTSRRARTAGASSRASRARRAHSPMRLQSPLPAPELRERILDTARAERTNVVPLRARWTPVAKALTAVAASPRSASASGPRRCRARSSRSAARATRRTARSAVLSDPNASHIALTGATTGSLVVTKNGEAALVVSRLDRAPFRQDVRGVGDRGREPRAGGHVRRRRRDVGAQARPLGAERRPRRGHARAQSGRAAAVRPEDHEQQPRLDPPGYDRDRCCSGRRRTAGEGAPDPQAAHVRLLMVLWLFGTPAFSSG